MALEYKDYTGTIKGLAYRYAQTTGISSQELISAGNEHFVFIQKTFDPKKSCFNTYLNLKLRSLFLNMGQKRKRRFKNEIKKIHPYENNTCVSVNTSSGVENMSEILDDLNPERKYIFAEAIMGLSSDAKNIVNIVFNAPSDLIDSMPKKQPRGINKFVLTKYLKKNKWNIGRILNAFNDIESIWS